MNNYTKSSKFDGPKFGGKKKFSHNPDHGARKTNSGSTEQFSATCSECNKKCDVPFKPSQNKPVYCSACFGMKKSGHELRGSTGSIPNRERKPFGNGTKFDHAAARAEKANPTSATPAVTADNILELKRQISGLEVKLNKILDLINPPLPPSKATKK